MRIPSYPGYSSDIYGRIFSHKSNRFMRPKLTKTGYLQLSLRKDGEYKTVLVHRLVAEAYLGPNNLDVNHIDGDKQNNVPTNLEYVSKSENQKHRGRILFKGCKEIVMTDGIETYNFKSHKQASERTGLTQQSISALYCGKRKVLNGWSLKETTIFTEI